MTALPKGGLKDDAYLQLPQQEQAAVMLGIGLVMSGWWYVRNLLQTGTISGLDEALMLRNTSIAEKVAGALHVNWLNALASVFIPTSGMASGTSSTAMGGWYLYRLMRAAFCRSTSQLFLPITPAVDGSCLDLYLGNLPRKQRAGNDDRSSCYASRFEEDTTMGLTRRTVLAAGAAAAASAAVPNALAQQAVKKGNGKFYEKGQTRIYYEEAGSGFPLLLIPGGGLNSTIGFFTGNSPFNAIEEFKGQYRCIAADLRNSPTGQSTGPVEVNRPWESYADDQIGLMDHLGIDKFSVMGFCIGGPFIWGLLKRAPNRIAGAVLAQPVGWRPEMKDRKYQGSFWAGWGKDITAKRPEISLQTTEQFVVRMFETNPDFVFTVTRDFVRSCQNPVLILPDDVPAHPLAVAMESAMLAPKAEISMFPWKEPKERIPLAVRQIHSFLKAHRPA